MKYTILLMLFTFARLTEAYILPDSNKKDTLKYETEPVVITATRYPEEVREIPLAVSVIGLKELKNNKGYGLDEVLSSIPGVLAQSRSGNQDVRITIRGYGARGSGDRSNSGTTRGIKILLDGFPETEPDGRTSMDNIDLSIAENIEVIRSNSSALWGNASGGIINISSIPLFESSFINASGLIGSFGFRKYVLQTGFGISNGKGFISFSNNTFDGWRRHSSSSRSILNAGIISFPSSFSKLETYLLLSNNNFHIPGPLTLSQYNSDSRAANPVYENRDERRNNRQARLGINFEHMMSPRNFISAMAYVNPKKLQRSERNTFRDFTRYHIGGNLIYRYEIKLKLTMIKFMAGIDEAYQDGAILFYSLSPSNSRGDVLQTNKREGANNFGAFFQNEMNYYDKLNFIFGGRYDAVTYYSEDFIESKFGLQEKSFKRFTPKVGINYRLTPLHSVYANIGGGIEVPAGNETDPVGTYGQDSVFLINPLLEPIVSKSYEIGMKQFISTSGFLNSFDYTLALYYINIKNDIVPYRGGRFYFTAGKSHRTGIEFQGDFKFKYGLSFSGAITLSLNRYDEYIVDSAHYGNPGSFADYKNNKVAGIPGQYYYASVKYTPSFADYITIKLSINSVGNYFADDANSIEAPSYSILNFSLGLDEIKITEHISLNSSLGVNNIFDSKYVSSIFINPDHINNEPVYLEPGLPGNFVFSLAVRFE